MEQAMAHENQTQFRLKLGTAEIEFVGDAEFLKDEILPVVSRIVEVAETNSVRSTGTEIKQIENGQNESDKFGEPEQVITNPVGSLASHIKLYGAENNQVRRFLVTADWICRRGNKLTRPNDVVVALRENQQAKLANASECLNKNVGKGHCEKTTDGFFVTPEGLKQLGSPHA
jgi:hypothetical protein